jgi:hypothetical protein
MKGWTDATMHASIHPFIHSFTHSLSHSFIHSIIPSFRPSFIHSFNQSFNPSFNHSIIHSFNHSIIQSFSQSIIFSTIHPCIHPSILLFDLFVRSFRHSFYLGAPTRHEGHFFLQETLKKSYFVIASLLARRIAFFLAKSHHWCLQLQQFQQFPKRR